MLYELKKKDFDYDITFSFYCEWEQLKFLWDKEIYYNWYDMTLINFYWSYIEFNRNYDDEFILGDLIDEDTGKEINRMKSTFVIEFGLLGFTWYFEVLKKSCE